MQSYMLHVVHVTAFLCMQSYMLHVVHVTAFLQNEYIEVKKGNNPKCIEARGNVVGQCTFPHYGLSACEDIHQYFILTSSNKLC